MMRISVRVYSQLGLRFIIEGILIRISDLSLVEFVLEQKFWYLILLFEIVVSKFKVGID